MTTTIDQPESATGRDLRTLADFLVVHPELDPEITGAVAELHIVLGLSHQLDPAAFAALVVGMGGRVLTGEEATAADPSFDQAEVALPAGAVVLNIHKMRPGGPMLAERVDPAGPVSFTEPDEATVLRATVDNLADELDRLLRTPPGSPAYNRVRSALIHRLQDVRRR